MKYIIREKIISLTNDFIIKDIKGRSRYIVESQFFSIGRKIRIYDINRNELIYIEEKLLSLFGEYRIYERGNHIMNIKREFSLFTPRFSIDSQDGNYDVEGNIIKYNFNIYRNRSIIASIDKKFISFSDTYTVDIKEEENHPLVLAIVIVLDQIYHDPKPANNTNQ